MSAPRKIIIIANPTAGRRKVILVDKAAAMLRERGVDVEVWHTTRPGDGEPLARRAVEQRPDIVVAAGGDGTINEVVNGFFDGDRPLKKDAVLGFLLGYPDLFWFVHNCLCDVLDELFHGA